MSRFEDISDLDLDLLLENRDSLSTRNVIKSAVSVLKHYCTEKGQAFPSGTDILETSALNCLLGKFYSAARKTDGKLYSKKSMLSIRYGLQKHFAKVSGFDIVNDREFGSSNRIFLAMVVKLKQEGKARVKHHEPLSKSDLQTLFNSFDTDTPSGLQDKVFVDFMLYFCNRGRENLRELVKTDFKVDENEAYIEIRDMKTKNHQGDLSDTISQGGRIYKTGTDSCPFTSFVKYVSVLNTGSEAFFQRPKSKPVGNTWFDAVRVGKNTLGDKMKTLSTSTNLSRVYTNHCLKATSITLLNGFEARHVMEVSGHKSESSIRSYARTSTDQKEQMALTLAKAVSGKSAQPGSFGSDQRVPVNPRRDTERITHTLAKATSGESVQPGPYGDGQVVPAASSVDPVSGIDLQNMDYLELTPSQENNLMDAFQTVECSQSPTTDHTAVSRTQPVPGPQAPHFALKTYNHLDRRELFKQQSSYKAPVYCFNNCSVTINHNN